MEQRTPEWFEARKCKVTASVVGAILGCSPFQKKEDIMRQMIREYYGAESEFKENPAMQWGTLNEEHALFDYEIFTGNNVKAEGFVTYGDWLGASPDGLIGEDGLVEIKCPYHKRDDANPIFKTIHSLPHYYAQVQIQMLVLDRKWCDFYQWSQYGYRLERVELDTDWLDENLPELKKFHQEYLTIRDDKNLSAPYLEDKVKTVESDLAKTLVDQYHAANSELSAAKKELETVKKEILKLCGDRDSDVCGLKVKKVSKKGNIKYKDAILQYCPDADLEPYRGKPSEYWKFS